MTIFQKTTLAGLRIAFGWLFLYAGISKLLNPEWTAAGYIRSAQTGKWFYELFLGNSVLPVINNLVIAGFIVLGIALVLGIGVRISAVLGSLLMLLFYFPILNFPYAGKNAFIVDEHIIYIGALLLLAAMNAGQVYGLEKYIRQSKVYKRSSLVRKLVG